jgi:hypothetical protein
MKDFKPMVKMQAGGSVGMGYAQPSGPMGIAAPGEKELPSREMGPRVGYKRGGQTKKRGK